MGNMFRAVKPRGWVWKRCARRGKLTRSPQRVYFAVTGNPLSLTFPRLLWTRRGVDSDINLVRHKMLLEVFKDKTSVKFHLTHFQRIRRAINAFDFITEIKAK